MNKQTKKKLLYKFTDPYRDAISDPFVQDLKMGRFICATNGNLILLIPETEENKYNSYQSKRPPNLNNILPDFTTETAVDLEAIIQSYKELPIIDRNIMERCPSCDGDGKFMHYGDFYNCKNCHETGEISTGQTEKVKKPETAFKLQEPPQLLKIKYVKAMLDVYSALEKTSKDPISLVLLNGKPHVAWFKMNDIYIAMSATLDKEEMEDWDIVDIKLKEQVV